MAWFDLALRCALAAVWAASAIGKLLSAGTSERLVAAFRLDRGLEPAARLLPIVELAVAAGLLVDPAVRPAAIAGCVLLSVFSLLVVRVLALGEAGNCECFGRFHESRISWRTLLRNSVLAVASVLAAALPPVVPSRGLGGIIGDQRPILLATAAAMGVLALILVLAAARSAGLRGQIEPELDGEPSGVELPRRNEAPAVLPQLDVTTLAGSSTAFSALIGSGRTVLVFVDPTCGPCRSVVPALRSWWERFEEGRLVVVSRGELEANRQVLEGLPAESVVIDDASSALARHFEVPGTPTAVVLNAGRAEAGPVVGAMPIEVLLRHAAGGGTAAEREWPLVRRLERLRHRGNSRPSRPRATLDQLLLPSPAELRGALSRREIFGAAPMVAGLALLARHPFSSRRPAAASSSGVVCPSCGTCTACVPATTAQGKPAKADCAPCHEACTTNKVCGQYANENQTFLELVTYLHRHGYRQEGEPETDAVVVSGANVLLALRTVFTGTSSSMPRALLTYMLTNTGESAVAAFLNPSNRIVSIITSNSQGQLTAVDVDPDPQMPAGVGSHATTTTTSSPSHSSATAGLSAVSSVQLEPDLPFTCGFYCTTAASVIPGLIAAGAVTAGALLLAPYIELGALAAADVAPSASGWAYENAALLGNFAIKTGFSALAWQFCNGVVCPLLDIKITYCCSYTGACFPMDSVCFAHCGVTLHYPDSWCYEYVNGKRIGGPPIPP